MGKKESVGVVSRTLPDPLYVKTRFSDLGDSLHRPEKGIRVEQRDYEVDGGGYTPRENGRSYIDIICPFCNHVERASLWSISGTGKRCTLCGAMFGAGHRAFRRIPSKGKK